MRTKPEVDSLSFNDLYNNLRVFENDVKGSTASSSSMQMTGKADEYDLEDMDVKWQVALISLEQSLRRRRGFALIGLVTSSGGGGLKLIGLKKVEAQLVAHQQGQLWYEEKIRFMKIDLDDKTDVLTYHKKLLAEAQKEKEDLKAKVEKWHNSSKNLGKLLNTQMSANDKLEIGVIREFLLIQSFSQTLIPLVDPNITDLA
ncbi:hypothetical protein Tco_0173046 [Tanacetum coccineum]